MQRSLFYIFCVCVVVGFGACKRDKDADVVPANTSISGRVLRFGTNTPAAATAMRIAVFEEEEASVAGSPAQIRLIQSFETDAAGNFNLGLNAMRHPRFKYYAQLQTSLDKHFDPANYKFYFEAGQTQTLNLYQYPHAWLRVKARQVRPGTGYHLSLSFANGSDYDIWGTTPFETTELLLGNSNQQIAAILTRPLGEASNYSFSKYLTAFDTLEHVIEF